MPVIKVSENKNNLPSTIKITYQSGKSQTFKVKK